MESLPALRATRPAFWQVDAIESHCKRLVQWILNADDKSPVSAIAQFLPQRRRLPRPGRNVSIWFSGLHNGKHLHSTPVTNQHLVLGSKREKDSGRVNVLTKHTSATWRVSCQKVSSASDQIVSLRVPVTGHTCSFSSLH